MRSFRSALAAIVVALTATAAAAQGSGGIEVTVVDNKGAPLPDATVTISHATGFVKTTAQLTDKHGVAAFPVLRPGSGYSIHVVAEGAAPVRHEDLRVSIGRSLSVSIQMTEAIVERVKVTAESHVLELESTETTSRFSEGFIADLPVPGRFYQNVLTMAPGVNDANGDGNPNVHGSRDRDFAAMVGGVRNVDPLTGQFMSQINPNSIEEIEVITAGAGVEFGRAQGGYARIIQKQGNNEHEGTFDLLYQTSNLDGTGASSSNNVDSPDFEVLRPGIQLSGPVLRDKLWYFVSADFERNEDPVNTGQSVEVETETRVTSANRLTWQVSPRNKLSFQYQSDPRRVDNVGVSSVRPPETTYTSDRTSETVNVTWTAPFSPKILVETVAGYQDLQTGWQPNTSGLTNDCATDQGGVLASAQCTDLDTGKISGSWPVTYDDNRQRFTLSGQTTVYGGRFWGMSHQFKFGMNVENERYFRKLSIQPSLAWLIVNSLGEDPNNTGQDEIEQFGLGFLSVAVPESDDVRATGTNWGFYAEDQFKPAKNLTMTLGVRVDREEISSEGRSVVDGVDEFSAFEPFASVKRNTAGNQTAYVQSISDDWPAAFTGYEDYPGFQTQLENLLCTGVPSPGSCLIDISTRMLNQSQEELFFRRRAEDVNIGNTNVSPAFSLAWSPGSNGKTAIKAAIGRHYNNIPLLVPLQELQPAQAVLRYTARLVQGGGGPSAAVLESGISPTITVQNVDRNLRTPYQDEFTFAIERELWTETSLSLTYINRQFKDQIQDINTNLDIGDYGACTLQQSNPTSSNPTPWIIPAQGLSDLDNPSTWILDPYTDTRYPDTDPGPGDGRLDDCVGDIHTVNRGPAGGGGGGPPNLLFDEFRRADGIQDLYVQNPFWGDIFLIGNFNEIDYEAVVVELDRRQYRNWEMRLSYTWSQAIGDGEDFFQELGDDPSLKGNQSGFQSYDQRHFVKFQATTITPWGLRIGTNIQWNSGLPFSLLLEERSFDTLPTLTNHLAGISQRNRQTYDTGVRNDQRNSSYWNVDLRVTKEFNLGRSVNMQLSADILNLLNDGTRIVWDPISQSGQNVNGINRGTRYRFGRQWQLGMKLNW